MNNMDQLITIFASSEVDEVIDFGGVVLQNSLSVEGCEGCVFDTEEKANGCKYKNTCMAHLRDDRQSIIFKNFKDSLE